MQKLFTLFVFSIFVFTANAQFQKGNKVLGAGLNFETGSTDYPNFLYKNTNFNIGLNMGFATKENMLKGFYVNTGFGKTKYDYIAASTPDVFSSVFDLSAGYYIRWYKSIGKGFYLFGEGNAGCSYSIQKNKTSSNTNLEELRAGISVYPGLSYELNKKILLELRFGDFASAEYINKVTDSPTDGKQGSRFFSVNSSLALGYLNNIGIGARWIIK